MSLIGQLKSVGRKLGLGAPRSSDPKTQAYIDFNRRKWGSKAGDIRKGVVLVGLFSWKPSIHCYSYVSNHLAAKRGGVVRTFYFQKKTIHDTASTFASFGAEPGVNREWATAEDRQQAELETDKIMRGLKTKWDVINISFDGVPLGDLIYDTYVRYLAKPTVILDDPDLRAGILEAIIIYYACRNYFTAHRVLGVITDHTVYTQCGVIVRVATILHIPVYIVAYSPRFLARRLDYQLERGGHEIQTLFPYYNYRKMFAALSSEEKAKGRERGRRGIQDRLSGKIDLSILTNISAYDAKSNTRLLKETGRPRILVLLHDFCDASHLYRKMLFPDFVEWCDYLFERAIKTGFDWYAKPHPNNRLPSRAAMNAANDQAIEELKARYPSVTFLSPSVSNRQLVDEGIASMFTLHGTAAHEFAYMGVPVVNAGENPHSSYTFNIHAGSLAEYDQLIATADRLPVEMPKEEIEEFFFMYYNYIREKGTTDAHPIDLSLLSLPDIDAKGGSSEVFEIFMRSATPEREAAITSYLDKALAE